MMRRDPFQAIADPNRRAILALISRESMNLNTVASHFSVSRPAISKHIKILRQCGLVEIRQKGRERYCEARLERLSEVVAWLQDYRSHWSTEIETMPVSLPMPEADRMSEPGVTEENSETTVPVQISETEAVSIVETDENLIKESPSGPDPMDIQPEMSVIASAEEQWTEASATEEVKRPSLVPWEEGYVEEQDEAAPTEKEIDLSAESVVDAPVEVDNTIEPNQETEQTTDEVQADPEPETQTPVRTTARPGSRKKKSPPTDTLQGSLF